MNTIPFGIIGTIIGHLVMGYNLSLVSIFGMVALTGVVVNDAIVLSERINENLASGMKFFDAIMDLMADPAEAQLPAMYEQFEN